MSYLYSIRIDCKETPQEFFTRYCSQRKMYNGRCLMVHEISKQAQKPHVHIILEDTRSMSRVRAEILDKWEKADYELDGRAKEYSIKQIFERDGELQKAHQYLCKGNDSKTLPDVWYRSEYYTEEQIKTFHKLYWEVNDAINARSAHNSSLDYNNLPIASVVPDTVSNVKKEKKKFLAQVADRCELFRPKDYAWSLKEDAQLWHDTLIQMHGKNFMPYNAHQIDKELNCLAAHFCSDEMIEQSKKNLNQFDLPWRQWLR